jgi:hypothetical protein
MAISAPNSLGLAAPQDLHVMANAYSQEPRLVHTIGPQ